MDELLSHLDRLHTTELGALRIERNLDLPAGTAVAWCRRAIAAPGAMGERRGKNWYVEGEGCVITVNARSYTIITAHRRRERH